MTPSYLDGSLPRVEQSAVFVLLPSIGIIGFRESRVFLEKCRGKQIGRKTPL